MRTSHLIFSHNQLPSAIKHAVSKVWARVLALVLFSHFRKHCKVQWKASETTLPIIVVSKLKIPDRSSQIVLQFFINKKESQKKKEAYIRRYDDDLWTPLCVLSIALWEEKLPTAEIVVDHDETQTTEHESSR
jgi:hypothetical protein